MTKVWRLVKEKHKREAFTGRGAADHPGRWNKEGENVVYCAGSLSLAALEILCHAGRRVKSLSYCYFEVSLPGNLTIDEPDQLPENWNDYPSPKATQEIGSDWYQRDDTKVLKVPSVHSPVENNYLIREEHLTLMEYGDPEEYRFAPRFYDD